MMLKHFIIHKILRFFIVIYFRMLNIPSQILYSGSDSSLQLALHMLRVGHQKILLVSDQQLVNAGVLDKVRSVVESEGGEVVVFSGVRPDPSDEIVAEGVNILLDNHCDSVLAIGGGSSMDTAKAIAASVSNGEIRNLEGFFKVSKKILPLYAIPTTAGTGSEATFAAVISNAESHKKYFIIDTKLMPVGVAIDPLLQVGMPAVITATTGMDALTHAIETYIAPVADDRVKEQSGMATKLLFKYLLKAYKNGGDVEAREAVALASYYAGRSINFAGVGTVHAIAHQLGSNYGIAHGHSTALVLPHVLDAYALTHCEEMAALGTIIGVGEESDSQLTLATKFIWAIRKLIDDLEIKSSLDDVKFDDIHGMAVASLVECRQYSVPRLMSQSEIEEIIYTVAS